MDPVNPSARHICLFDGQVYIDGKPVGEKIHPDLLRMTLGRWFEPEPTWWERARRWLFGPR